MLRGPQPKGNKQTKKKQREQQKIPYIENNT